MVLKQFDDFLKNMDVEDIRETALLGLIDIKLSKHEKEIIGSTMMSIATTILSQYHAWLSVDRD